MFAATPLFMTGLEEKVAAFAIKCLAVGGGFLVGYGLGGAVGWVFNKWVFAEKAPDVLKQTLKVVAGIALALLVALIVFGDGSGGGLFGGGADGSGKGQPDADNTAKDKGDKPAPPVTPTPPKDLPKVEVPKTNADIRPDDPRVRVTFLGGDAVQGDRFYLLDDEPVEKAKSFKELQDAITQRKQGETRQMYLVVQFPTDRRIAAAETSVTVTQVTDWARDVMGIKVVLPEKK
jgi:hypothetical protein